MKKILVLISLLVSFTANAEFNQFSYLLDNDCRQYNFKGKWLYINGVQLELNRYGELVGGYSLDSMERRYSVADISISYQQGITSAFSNPEPEIPESNTPNFIRGLDLSNFVFYNSSDKLSCEFSADTSVIEIETTITRELIDMPLDDCPKIQQGPDPYYYTKNRYSNVIYIQSSSNLNDTTAEPQPITEGICVKEIITTKEIIVELIYTGMMNKDKGSFVLRSLNYNNGQVASDNRINSSNMQVNTGSTQTPVVYDYTDYLEAKSVYTSNNRSYVSGLFIKGK